MHDWCKRLLWLMRGTCLIYYHEFVWSIDWKLFINCGHRPQNENLQLAFGYTGFFSIFASNLCCMCLCECVRFSSFSLCLIRRFSINTQRKRANCLWTSYSDWDFKTHIEVCMCWHHNNIYFRFVTAGHMSHMFIRKILCHVMEYFIALIQWICLFLLTWTNKHFDSMI